ncbi:MAG TPA: transglycosylase SLT domain-containing protein [Pseudolabrys sp.]|nr:transglycosylase SLT domain-containing protein [Pseudolabrys sp.]
MPKTRPLQFAFLVAVCALAAALQVIVGKTMIVSPVEAAEASSAVSSNSATSALSESDGPSLLPNAKTDNREKEQGRLAKTSDVPVEKPVTATDPLNEQSATTGSLQDPSIDPTPRKQNFSLLAYYVFSEIPPEEKPADTVLKTMNDVPIGTPIEEIKRASNAFGLDFNFMKAVAKIESGFNPKQRTGSYIGLFQLSKYEFKEYGSGKITDPRDNAVAGAYKFATQALLFEYETGKKPTFSDLYLIHQQGWQGAAQHVSHPKRVAWKSMCATDEGKEKGERWCKLAIWRNTLPAIKQVWKSVNKLTSGAFVSMWRQRVNNLYSQYSVAIKKN